MISRFLAASLCALTIGLPSAALAQGRPITIAPNLRVSFVGYTSGRLVIIGNTRPNVLVTLEQTFHLRANAAGDFTYTLLYVVPDCIVDISTQYGLGRAIVAGCGPKGATGAVGPRGLAGDPGAPGAQGPIGPAGVSPQGNWEEETEYHENDLVYHDGSTWRATGDTEDEPGGEGEDWELFASGGQDGQDGADGVGGAAMFAVVEGNGTWSRGYPSGDVYTSQRFSTGTYEVIFGTTNINSCGFIASLGTHNDFGQSPDYPPGTVLVIGRAGNDAGVWVETYDSAGNLADHDFHLSVVCSPVEEP